MMRLIKKDYFIILILLSSHLLFISLLINVFYPIKYEGLNFFFSELLSKPFSISLPLILLCDLGIFYLMLLISKKVFIGRSYLLVLLIYSISPWSMYLVAAQSFYVFLLFFLMLFAYTIFLLKENKKIFGNILLVSSIIIICYSSFILFIVLPLLITTILVTRIINFRLIKKSLIFSCIALIPLIILMFNNQEGVYNISKNQIKILDNPGLINSVDMFLGEARSVGYGNLARLTENKYVYLSKYLLLKLMKNTSPVTFFTQQEKLLNFSFTPPILFGFLLPFLFGTYLLFISRDLRKYLILFVILIIPSFLSSALVDLNRLLVIEPLIIFTITYGLIKFKESKNIILSRYLLFIVFFIVFIQYWVTLSDIVIREYQRYGRVYQDSFKTGKQ